MEVEGRGVKIYLYNMGRKVIPLAINGMKKVKMKTIEWKNDGITGRGGGAGKIDRSLWGLATAA